jgi:hypothetical protein
MIAKTLALFCGLALLGGCVVIEKPLQPIIDKPFYEGLLDESRGIAEIVVDGVAYTASAKKDLGFRFKGFLREVVFDRLEFEAAQGRKITCNPKWGAHAIEGDCFVEAKHIYDLYWVESGKFFLYSAIQFNVDPRSGRIELSIEAVKYAGELPRESIASGSDHTILLSSAVGEPLACRAHMWAKQWQKISCHFRGTNVNIQRQERSTGFHI